MGTVFNIQHFSIHDGPGIRTVVFLKGCPLRCKWCANPESQRQVPEMGWTKENCIGCGSCLNKLRDMSCRFEGERLYWDSSAEIDENKVKDVCPSKAFHLIGNEMTASEVIDEVVKDLPFYNSSEGGLTLSGGEPLMQPEFSYEILRNAKEAGIHRAIETCSHATWDILRKIASEVDYLLTDVKTIDDEVHRKWTGITNKTILDNIRHLRDEFPNLEIHIRTPVIPGVNDSIDAIEEIVEFAQGVGANYELLRYHRLGLPKYEALNRSYPMGNVTLKDETFMELESLAVRKYIQNQTRGKYGSPTSILHSESFSFIDGAGI